MQNQAVKYSANSIFGPIIFEMTNSPRKDFSKKEIEDEKKQFEVIEDYIEQA